LFLEAVVPVLQDDAGLHVICAGGKGFSASEQAQLEAQRVSGRFVHLPLVSDDQLAALYGKAGAFVFPSLYEGFGIPVLESFACDCPAILSSTSSLPEVGGEAACYFDPADAESLRTAITRVMYDGSFRTELVARGRERLKQFSWEHTAEQTRLCYESIL
jgi:glycosyltransferase involved in cell wall biosynthesis